MQFYKPIIDDTFLIVEKAALKLKSVSIAENFSTNVGSRDKTSYEVFCAGKLSYNCPVHFKVS